MSEPGTVGIIIRCRNEEAHIGRLLTGIMRQRRQPDEIVVVDSGSTDATLAIAAAFPVKVVQIRPEEFSFGAACNYGLERCESSVAVFISAHCYPVYDTWLELLIEPFHRAAVAITYGRQIAPTEGRFSEKRLLSQWFPAESDTAQDIPFCNNANAAIRTSVWRDGIKYDEALTGLEDLDWAKRALTHGHEISYIAEAPVVHVHDESWSQIVNRYRREAIAQREIHDKDAMRLRLAVRLAGLSIARDFAAARREGQLTENLWDIPKFRAAQYLGTYRGYAQSDPVSASLKHRFYYPEESKPSSALASELPGNVIDYEAPDSSTQEF